MKRKSGLADSPFFISPTDQGAASIVYPAPPDPARDTVIPRHHDTTTPRSRATTVEHIRKAVKEFGKEAATHRFTVAEKRAIADIVYALGQQGLKTSENELARIAINWLLDDYHHQGQASLLAQTVKALRE